MLKSLQISWQYGKLYDIRCRIFNLFFGRHNRIILRKYNITDYIEVDERIFESIFEILCEYVEEQLAWMELISHNTTYSILTRFRLTYLPRSWTTSLRRELAFRYLDWEMTLVGESTGQAEVAKKVKDLYIWYNDIYPNIPDPFDLALPRPKPPAGRNEWEPHDYDENGNVLTYRWYSDTTPEWQAYYDSNRNAFEEQERLYQEATSKAIQVLEIRQSLWT